MNCRRYLNNDNYRQYDNEHAIDHDSYNENDYDNTMIRHNDAKYGQTIVTIEIARRQLQTNIA